MPAWNLAIQAGISLHAFGLLGIAYCLVGSYGHWASQFDASRTLEMPALYGPIQAGFLALGVWLLGITDSGPHSSMLSGPS
jgi:hypothetical protein